MRISDWSSDFCSSALQSLALQLTLGGRLGDPVFNPPAATQAVYPEETDRARAAKSLIGRLPRSPEFPDEIRVKFRQMPGYEAKVNLLLDGPFFVLAVEDAFGDYLYTWPHPDFQPQALANVADGEIGRASCRERVCQYV